MALQRETVAGISWGWVKLDLSVVLPLKSHEHMSKAAARLYAVMCGM